MQIILKSMKAETMLFQIKKLVAKKPSCTLTATFDNFTHWSECRKLTYREWKRLGSFPDDYQAKTDKIGKYMIGMSVPPKMTEVVARAVYEQWLSTNLTKAVHAETGETFNASR